MIDVTFHVTGDGGEARDILVRVREPFRNPPEKEWPWSIVVDVDGRAYTTYGMDPLDAIVNASRHAAILLHGVYAGALEPAIERSAHDGSG